jgi:dTDP-4-dehydrorhamnose reductase
MRILITGANGLLGQKLLDALCTDLSTQVLATSRGESRLAALPEHITYEPLDITNQQEVMTVVAEFSPDVIIHTAAMTNVDQCEEEREACWEINVTAVKYLVEVAELCDAHFIHLSTDFIFSGEEGPLDEQAIPAPVNYYGESKLAAEEVVKESATTWAIARTVLVYGVTAEMSRSNIILWVKTSLEKGEAIKVVNDQWRTPTLAEDLASGCILIAQKHAEGIFNISGKDFLTPYEMAMQTANYFDLDASLIAETNFAKFQQKAKRPPKTGFIIDKAVKTLGYQPRSFQEGIEILDGQISE